MATLKDGRKIHGELRGGSPDQLRFLTTDQQEIPLAAIQSLAPPTPAALPVARGALRHILLTSGEVFAGDIVQWNHETVQLRLAGRETILTIPTQFLAGVLQPPGMVNLVFEDFDGEDLESSWSTGHARDRRRGRSGTSSLLLTTDGEPLEHALATPLSAGFVALSFHENDVAKTPAAWHIEFRFQTQLGDRLLGVVVDAAQNTYGIEAPLGPRLTPQRLRRTTGWHDLRLRFDELDTLLSLDGSVLATGPPLKGVLTSIRIRPAPSATAAKLWIDDVQIARFVEAQPLKWPTSRQDVAQLTPGDEIYGTIEAVDASTVRMTGKFGAITLAWPDLRGLFRRTSETPFPKVDGTLARIQFHETTVARNSLPSTLTAAIQEATTEGLTIHHPVLGRLSWPWPRIARIEPLFDGQYQLLFPGGRHLGDEIRSGFRRQEPDGQRLELTFHLKEIPETAVFVTLNAAQLEPSGPRTPPGRPYLQELRGGHLVTTLSVNGKPIESLNHLIHFRAAVDQPDRLRVRIPRDALVAGENRLTIQQAPSQDDATDFDDCEISHIALEIAAPKAN